MCTGEGQECEEKEIKKTGCGYQPAVGGKILADTMKAMTHDAPWLSYFRELRFFQELPLYLHR